MSRIPERMRKEIAAAAAHRCGYCQASQQYVFQRLEVDHIVPVSRGGTDDEANLWLACGMCNRYKGEKIEAFDPQTNAVVALFNPRTQVWTDHFKWNSSGTRIVGLTPCGRATVRAIRLNNGLAVRVRGGWVRAGWHPPK